MSSYLIEFSKKRDEVSPVTGVFEALESFIDGRNISAKKYSKFCKNCNIQRLFV